MKTKQLSPLKIVIPARLRPHIRASFYYELGYGERAAAISLLQSALMEDIKNKSAEKLRETKELLKGGKK